jgi:hypothetical protein
MDKRIIADCKQHIDAGDLPGLQALYAELMTAAWDYQPDWASILQQVYLHACLKKRRAIASWLEQLFRTQLDPVAQIAHRQMFPYGRYLLRK